MSTLLRPTPPVHSNPPPAAGPALAALGRELRYTPCYLPEIAAVYAAAGSLADAPVDLVDLEDLAALELACEADAPREPRLPFAEWIQCQASWFGSQDTAAGRWLAAELTELADLARALCATGPEELDDRREALNRSMRETSFDAFLARESQDFEASLPR